MYKFRKGDIVGRVSYNKDIIFVIKNIIKTYNNKEIYILKGLTERIEVDSPKEDLELIDKSTLNQLIGTMDNKIFNRETNNEKSVYFGKILHLDGDKRYAEKSSKYYKHLGLNAIVKNIPENKQPNLIKRLLEQYNPDILVITGHDGMIKKQTAFNDVYNYRNSRYFINTVREARKWSEENSKNLAIFGGACQSFYEGIILAGANFASSPKRIMIDFMDPLIVAERIATTDSRKYLTISDIEEELRDGRNGVNGTGSMGKKTIFNKINL